MAKINRDDCVPCRHVLDREMITRLSELLFSLPDDSPDLLESHEIDPDQYELIFRASVERIRGTFAATVSHKRRFIEAILDYMKTQNYVQDWAYIGTGGRQDYKINLQNGRVVGIEAKGCPDGNNMNIWELPPWADEFIIWSQCPYSMDNEPGVGIWSGISTRMMPNMIANNEKVDAFIFYDGRCGSENRRCTKAWGIEGNLRETATDIHGQDDRSWLPPPCVWMFPRTVAHKDNREPLLHDISTCTFPGMLLSTFNVPEQALQKSLRWARVELELRKDGQYVKVCVGEDLGNKIPSVSGGWKLVRRV